MNTLSIGDRFRTLLISGGLTGALLFPVQGISQNAGGATANSTRAATAASSQENRSGTRVENVRVTRASTFLGSDVIGTDGRKVGDIVDYFFDLNNPQSLAYVVIMTGGFLDIGGDRRAVPAASVTATGDSVRVNISSDQFWNVPVLPENGPRFLSDAQNRQRISEVFTQAGGTSAPGQANARPSEPNSAASRQNQAGAMTGRPAGEGQNRLVSFSELRNEEAYGPQDTRLGYFEDVWLNLNDNVVPYIEITQVFNPLRSSFDRRYAIPAAKFGQPREYSGFNMTVTENELNEATPVSEAQGVEILRDGTIGNAVLRVTVPRKQ